MAVIVHATLSDEVYNGTKKLMKPEDQNIDKVFIRALTFYKFARDVEAAGGEVTFKVKGEKHKRIKVP